MADPGRMRGLLAVAALLAALRFGLAPLFAWQEETREAIALLARQSARAEGLKERSRAVAQATAALEEAHNALTGLYHAAADAQSLQLAAQKEIEKWAEAEHLKVERIGWGRAATGEAIVSPLELALEGEYTALRGFLHRVEGAKRFYTVAALTVNGDHRRPGQVKVKLDLVAHGLPPAAPAATTRGAP